MAIATEADLPATAAVVDSGHSYVDWGAVIAGAVLAAAISFVLVTFGTAIGLSLTSAYRGNGASLPWLALAAALWLLWVEVSSFMAGAYIAGRMRHRAPEATQHEVDVRDGTHGLLVWATGTLVGAVITALIALSGALSASTGPGSYGVATIAGDSNDSSLRLVTLSLFRGATARDRDDAAREDVVAILANGATGGTVTDAERAYATRIVADETGLSTAEATTRFNAALSEARDAAERARKIGILVAFITAAALAVSAAGSVFAARRGGHHRDKGLVFGYLFKSY